MAASRPAAVIEVSADPKGGVPAGLIQAAYLASREGTVVLVLNGVSPAQADRALDPIVPEVGGVAGVVYCTPATLEPFLLQRGWPRVAGVGSRALAAPLTQRGVVVLPPDRALRALGELGVASGGGARLQVSCTPQEG
jgi:hypothetical protein